MHRVRLLRKQLPIQGSHPHSTPEDHSVEGDQQVAELRQQDTRARREVSFRQITLLVLAAPSTVSDLSNKQDLLELQSRLEGCLFTFRDGLSFAAMSMGYVASVASISVCLRLKELEGGYTYQGEQTCAADGMCQVKCPVGINTGELIKSIRADQLDASEKSYGYGMSQACSRRPQTSQPCASSFCSLCDLYSSFAYM